jgi:hypothetical protein
MHSQLARAAAGWTLAAALAAPAHAGNLLVNGGFETPIVPSGGYTNFGTGSTAITGWTVVGPQVAVVSGEFTEAAFSFPAKQGAQWVDLTGCCTNALQGVQQTVSTMAGATYRLSFWVGNVAGAPFGSSSTVEVRIDGVSVGEFTNSIATQIQEWQPFLITFVADAASTTITFLNRDPSTETHNGLDNVSLGRVPTDLALDFGPTFGAWVLTPATWTQLHNLSPVGMVTGDLDGDGSDDLVLNFGAAFGVWAWMNHATWQFLHPFSPSQMVSGDLDHNSRDDLVFVFPGYGVWRWSDGDWSQLHSLDASRLAIGQIDGVTGDDLILDFPGYGLYVFANNSTWTGLHPFHAAALLTADLDGNGQEEIVINFGAPYGLWVYRNNATWTELHRLSPARLVEGEIDGDGRPDLVMDFGPPYGLWTFRNDATWAPLHGFSAEGIVLADRDGTGKDEIVIDFGPTYGLWQYANDSTWNQLHGLSPAGLVAGRFH